MLALTARGPASAWPYNASMGLFLFLLVMLGIAWGIAFQFEAKPPLPPPEPPAQYQSAPAEQPAPDPVVSDTQPSDSTLVESRADADRDAPSPIQPSAAEK